MPTRLYLPYNITPPISPAFDAEWNGTTNTPRYYCKPEKQNTAMTDRGYAETSSTTPFDGCMAQYVSPPLEAQTISGDVKGQIRAKESAAEADMCRAVVIKVVSNDGGTVRGTLLSHFPGSLGSEFATSLTNRNFPPSTALTPVTAQKGDRLVIEIGFRAFNAVTTSYTGTLRLGDSAAADLPEDEADVNDYNGWLEFSAVLDFIDEIEVGQVNALVEYAETPQLRVTHLGVQVEYEPTPPGQFTYAGNIVMVNTPSATTERHFEKTGDVTFINTVEGAYVYQPPGAFIYAGDVRMVNTVAGNPIHDRVYSGNVIIAMTPEAQVSMPDRIYAGEIGMVMKVEGAYRMPVPGWEPTTGYGLCELDDLDEPPPFWCVEGENLLSLNLEPDYALYAEYRHEIAGGLVVGGSLAAEFAEPEDLGHLIGGGVAVGGGLAPRFVDPREFLHVVSGGVRARGGFEVEFPEEEAPPLPYHRVLRRGVEVGGALNVQFVEVETLAYELVLSGGVAVGPFRRAPVEFYDPSDLPVSDPYVYEFGTWGGVKIEGVFAFEFPEGDIFAHEVRRGGVRAGGSLGVSFFVPKVAEHRIRGEVVIDGSVVEDEQVYETWALTGFGFEPSMYSPFPFNSYVSADGRTYALAENGLYLLEGEDDDGQPIHSGVRIGPANFGADNYKRLRAVYPGQAGNPEIRVRAVTKGKEEYRKLARERFNISVDVQDRVMLMELSDFDRLNQFEVVRVTLAKR